MGHDEGDGVVTPGGHAPPRFRGTRRARWLACALIGITVVLVLALVVADQAQYVLLLPLATYLAKAVVVMVAPLLLGVAWWSLTRTRQAARRCVTTTSGAQVAAIAGGWWLFVLSGVSAEFPLEKPEVLAVSPAADFEVVWTVHSGAFGVGLHESLWVRSRAGLLSRQSRTELAGCSTSYFEQDGRIGRHVIDDADVSFVDETAFRLRTLGADHVVRFDPATLGRAGETDGPPTPIQC